VAIPRVPDFSNGVLDTSKASALGDAAQYGINPTGCGVARVAVQSIANGGTPLIDFDTEDFDSGGQFAATSNTITVAEPGFYQLSGYGEFASNATGYRLIQIEVNGATITGNAGPAANGTATKCSAAIGKLLAAGDAISMRVTQNSGSSLNFTGRLSIVRGSGT
jgi:hypothetical protein